MYGCVCEWSPIWFPLRMRRAAYSDMSRGILFSYTDWIRGKCKEHSGTLAFPYCVHPWTCIAVPGTHRHERTNPPNGEVDLQTARVTDSTPLFEKWTRDPVAINA